MMKWMRLLEKHCGATSVGQPTSLRNGYLAFSWLPGSCSWPGAYACFSCLTCGLQISRWDVGAGLSRAGRKCTIDVHQECTTDVYRKCTRHVRQECTTCVRPICTMHVHQDVPPCSEPPPAVPEAGSELGCRTHGTGTPSPRRRSGNAVGVLYSCPNSTSCSSRFRP
jgi:hypothetical protein